MIPNPRSMLPPEARAWLAAHLPSRAGFVLEFGSGHGSRLLQDAIAPAGLISIEHDERFMEFADIYAPIRDGWYDADAIAPHIPDQLLAVVVDGPPAKIGRRGLLANLHLFPEGVPFLLDDAHRPDDLEVAQELAWRLDTACNVHQCGERAFATVGWP